MPSKLRKPVTYQGSQYSSLKSLCRDHGLSYKAIYERMHNGKTLEEALAIGPSRKRGSPTRVVYKGVEYESIKELAKATGRSYRGITKKMKAGASVEEAVGRTIQISPSELDRVSDEVNAIRAKAVATSIHAFHSAMNLCVRRSDNPSMREQPETAR